MAARRQETRQIRHVGPALAAVGVFFIAIGLLPLAAATAIILKIAGLALFFAGLAVLGVLTLTRLRQVELNGLIRTVLAGDKAPALLVSDQGEVLAHNAAHAPVGRGTALADLLSPVVANPDTYLRRMHRLAASGDVTCEELPDPRGGRQISVQKLDNVYIWRFPLGEKCPLAEDHIPRATVTLDGRVTASNAAFRGLAGTPETLPMLSQEQAEQGVPWDLPVGPGGDDTRSVVSCEARDGAQRALALLPVVASAPAAGWGDLEDLPVPLLKLGLDGRILQSNRGAEEILQAQFSPDSRLSDFLEGLGRPMADWLAEVARAGSRPQHQFLRGAGSRKNLFIQVTLCAGAPGASPPSLIAVLNDVTEFKALEAQFVQSQKMQAIGQLAGGVAHDFNNLLTAISGHCDLLLTRHAPDDAAFPDLIQIQQNANRAAALVGQLLAYSRKQDMQLEDVDLRASLSELTHLLNRLVGEKIALHLDLPPQIDRIRADKRQFEQVVMNLVVNARDATEGSGTVTISAREEHLDQPVLRNRATIPPGDYVLISVTDEGCGIPPEMLPHIFEPFYTTKGVGEGTGLGLSTAYGIVKQTGGFIFAESEVDVGSTFVLYFPAVVATDAPKAEAPAVSEEGEDTPQSATVLLVEDEAPVRAFATKALTLKGYDVIEADCGEEALELLADSALVVDLVVSDVIMPGLDGPSWVKEALKTRPDMTVIFMSGYSEDGIRDNRDMIAGAGFLPKPFSLTALTEIVHQQLTQARS